MRKRIRIKQKIHGWIGLFLTVVVMAVVVLTWGQQSLASWVEEEDGIRYQDETGQYVVGFQVVDEKKYYFDEDGLLVTGKFYVSSEDAYYYADKNGIIQIGVVTAGKKRYLTDDAGKIQTGFVEYENQKYYYSSKAEVVTGWFKDGEQWYYADEKGVVLTGFVTVNGTQYYFNEDGTRVQAGTLVLDGVPYVFRQDGSVDETATALYPVYQYLSQLRENASLEPFSQNAKLQACALERAQQLENGFSLQDGDKETLEQMISNRGVLCTGGYEFSYGGTQDASVSALLTDMQQDVWLQEVVMDSTVTGVGCGVYQKDDISYYDLIFITTE